MPEHLPDPPTQSRVAEAIVQLEAPGTVGPPELALDPGAVGAGSVAGCCWSPPLPGSLLRGSPPVVSELTVALAVDRACTSGAMLFASGPDEAPEFVTTWHTPPTTPWQVPSEREPRGSGDTEGSVAVAALVTFPVHTFSPLQVSAAPAAEAADGPLTSRAVLTRDPSPASACVAPAPVEAVDTDCAWQPPVPPWQVADPFDVRGVPLLIAPSQAAELVCTMPEQDAPSAHCRLALDDDTDDGALVACPAIGFPVAGSTITWSGALDAAELVTPWHPPPATVQSADAEEPRA